jgi:hypothetical protein
MRMVRLPHPEPGMSHPVRHAALGLTLLSTACSSGHPQTQPVPDVVAGSDDRVVRIRLQDGSSLRLIKPQMVGDTLTGFAIQDSDPTPRRLAADQVQAIEVRTSDPGSTAALVAGVGAVLVGVGLAIVSGGTYCC